MTEHPSAKPESKYCTCRPRLVWNYMTVGWAKMRAVGGLKSERRTPYLRTEEPHCEQGCHTRDPLGLNELLMLPSSAAPGQAI